MSTCVTALVMNKLYDDDIVVQQMDNGYIFNKNHTAVT